MPNKNIAFDEIWTEDIGAEFAVLSGKEKIWSNRMEHSVKSLKSVAVHQTMQFLVHSQLQIGEKIWVV